jgi:hypothetical protein
MGLMTLLPILGFTLLLARRFETTHSVALLHSVAGMILILYVGGLVGVLWWTALALHIVGVGFLGIELRRLGGRGDRLQVPIPMAVLVVCTVLFSLAHGADRYAYYDEYSHWGVYLKEMLFLDGLWDANTNSMHPRYPPAAPLWQYFFNVFREPSEGTAYLAQFVLLLTPFLVLWERLEWRRAHWALLIVALCLLAVTDFGLGVTSLYVDHVIGAWFVGTILCYSMESPGLRRGLLYCLPLTLIALLKESSLAFALACAAILGSLAACRMWRDSGRFAPSAVKGGIAAIAIVVPAVLSLGLWQWHLDRIGAPADLEAVGGIVSGLHGEGDQLDPQQGAELTRRFIEVFNSQQLSNDAVSRQFNAFTYSIRDLFTEPYRLSTAGLFAIFAVWWAVLLTLVLRGWDRWRWGVVACGIALTAAAYIFALYLRYRYTAGEYGLNLSSYMRYVHTVALPMLIASFAPLLPAFRSLDADRAWIVVGRVPLASFLAVLGCVGLYILETPYLRPVYEKNSAGELRSQLEQLAAPISASAGRSRVWVYLPNDYPNQFVGRLLQYLLAPTPAYVERDAEYFTRDPADVFEKWAGFDYVWVPAELEPRVAERFAEITGLPLTERFFVVSHDASGESRLRRVTESSEGLVP